MKQIKITQTQALSLVGESVDGLASAPAAIDERVITDEVLGVLQGHRKGVGRIVKGKKKAPETFYSTLSSGSQSQVIEE